MLPSAHLLTPHAHTYKGPVVPRVGAGRGEGEEKEDAGREEGRMGREKERTDSDGKVVRGKGRRREGEMGRGERKEEGSVVKPP